MKIVRSNKSGHLVIKEKLYFGGEFSFLQKLKLNGTGSNKLIYIEGIEELDLLYRDVEGELIFVNFEILPNGLILRANCNQRLMNLGVRLSDISEINLTGYRIDIGKSKFGIINSDGVAYRGELEILEIENHKKTIFRVVTREYNQILAFFKSSHLVHLFSHSISINEPETDNSDLLDFLSHFV